RRAHAAARPFRAGLRCVRRGVRGSLDPVGMVDRQPCAGPGGHRRRGAVPRRCRGYHVLASGLRGAMSSCLRQRGIQDPGKEAMTIDTRARHVTRTMPAAIFSAVLLAGFAASVPAQEAPAPCCWIRPHQADLEIRASPFDSTSILLDGGEIKVCYSRPRMLGRPIMGRLVRYGEPWRFGAD